MSALESVEPIATGNTIHIYTELKRNAYPVPDVLLGMVQFDPPIPEPILKNEVLAWILLDPTQRKFVSYQADSQGLVSVVTHKLRTQRNNFRDISDLMDYYSVNSSKWRLE